MFEEWIGVTSSGLKTHLAFVEDGIKDNHHVYLNMLKLKVVPWMNALVLNNGLRLQQDGATAHTSNSAHAWCQRNFTAIMLKEMWPPSSPDLNLMDFEICSILEQKACIVFQSSVDTLKKNLTDSWDKVENETVRATCAQAIPRLNRVIRE